MTIPELLGAVRTFAACDCTTARDGVGVVAGRRGDMRLCREFTHSSSQEHEMFISIA
jgi:hypothetical protein